MLSTIHHPVFGSLVPDQWNQGLLTFRQFPHMRLFWYANSARAMGSVSDQERAWVKDWQQHGKELARICRNSNVHVALQSLGVYEVSVSAGKDGQPTPAQAETYQMFLDQEETICRNVQDALLRYYRHAREVIPDWFEGEDFPEGTSIEELAPIITFDGISIRRRASHGLCPVLLGWDPDWDPEHGLSMTLYRDQVLEIGQAGESLLLEYPEEFLTGEGFAVWGPDQLNDAEREALEQFVEGYQPSGG